MIVAQVLGLFISSFYVVKKCFLVSIIFKENYNCYLRTKDTEATRKQTSLCENTPTHYITCPLLHIHASLYNSFYAGNSSGPGQLSRYSDSLRTGRSGDRGRSEWPSGLRRGSAADRLLGMRVRISPGA